MSERLSQANRIAQLITPLGDDVLVLVKLDATEGISENFEWRIHALLNEDEDDVDPEAIIGTGCHIKHITTDGEKFYHGVCTEIRQAGHRGRYVLYEVVLRPWTWLLTLEVCCEIWHEKSVEDIITEIFDNRSFTDYRFDLNGSYDPIPYCVQYQETTYDFVSRQMEKFGLYFYFDHTDSKHELVITDHESKAPDIGAYGALVFQPDTRTGMREDRIWHWETENRLRTAVIDVDDYNYEEPTTALEKTGDAKDAPGHEHADLKRYLYPTGHRVAGLGQKLADVIVDVHRADAQRKFANGYAPMMYTGGAFTLDRHPSDAENAKHIVVRAHHELFLRHYVSTGDRFGPAGPSVYIKRDLSTVGQDDQSNIDHDHYQGRYEVVDASKAFKAPKKTPWPRIHGAQTAVVIKEDSSPDDEEIDVDDKGRILVKFHWNKEEEGSDKCSCRLRVAQIWAGPQWGGVWIPRVGQEVVVEFLNGDPDRPLVTGAVYNGVNASPIDFPGDKTKSTIKSDSSKGSNGFNELRFEDLKDDEEIYIHAERDRLMEIEHDDDVTIGRHRTETIGGDHTWELTGGDQTITLKGAPGTNDKYGESITKNGHRTTTLEKGDETLTITEGKRTTTIKGNDEKTIQEGDETTTISQGDQTIEISLGKGETTAMTSFEIKVGASSIKLEPAKITIKSVQIEIAGDAQLEAKSPMTTVKGDAMLILQGGLTKIN